METKTVPEILDVLAEEVQPFDMVDEGLRVCTTRWHYQPSVVVMHIGIMRPDKDEDGVIYPAWSAIQERTYKQGEMVRVIRGLPALIDGTGGGEK